ncbi:MAG: 50S ribosomal protein L11 methyltransferase [Bacteroidia bacterium]
MEKINYIQLKTTAPAEQWELITAVLGEAGFSTFEETATELIAYIPENEWNEALLKDTMEMYMGSEAAFTYETNWVAAVNWNEEWEKNYPNLYLDTFCQVLPSFRVPTDGFTHTIIIDPKMSFGTGHHDTTQSVMRLMQDIDFQGKIVLDMGCGTGILGILASKMGAKTVIGIDIDPWCYENGQENITLNHITNMEMICGVAENIPNQTFDIILANINRNILLADGAAYVSHLSQDKGVLILSGFYDEDEAVITEHYEELGLTAGKARYQQKWMAKVFHS